MVMHIQIINFNLNDLSHEDYSRACNDIAQNFADLPGLISKHWLANEDTNTYGGVYFWESREAMENYLQSEVFAQVANNPAFANAASKDFAILEGPTKTTRGVT
ncbi:YdhR family protein [Verrucomicrobia bacterium]|jgi:heme-degrading monooxygenase HmoA|nr:YdhR family protein [Verrucomicrobiota bacterium]